MNVIRLVARVALFLAFQAQSTEALKIVSLSPHTTELAFDAGLGDNLVGVSAYSDYPEQAKRIEIISDYQSINIERILDLNPDLILAWQGGNPAKSLAQLEDLGFKLFYSKPLSLKETADNIEALGKFSADPEKAKMKAQHIRQTVAKIEAQYKNKPLVSYFYQIGQHSMMTNNQAHWPQPLFTLCGGENIFAQSVAPYPQVNIEQIIAYQPQAIFSPSSKNQTDSAPFAHSKRWQAWQDHIPALKNNAVFTLNADWVNRPTARSLLALEQICQALDQVRAKHSIKIAENSN